MRIFSTGFSEEFDGPGRRWVVYLKGCNLRCHWCASPESFSSSREILFYPDRSKYCDKSCPFGAVLLDGDTYSLDREKCESCKSHNCVTVFNDPAFEIAGQDMTVDQLVCKADSYQPLFGSTGGVTFGGGEPTLQDVELFDTIVKLREKNINVAVETNGTTDAARGLVGNVDLLICDLKCFSRDVHIQWTGNENDKVLETISHACKERQNLLVRVPLVCGFNDSRYEWKLIADFLCESKNLVGELTVEVLRMHHIGKSKYKALGIEYLMDKTECPTPADANELAELLQNRKINARVCA